MNTRELLVLSQASYCNSGIVSGCRLGEGKDLVRREGVLEEEEQEQRGFALHNVGSFRPARWAAIARVP